MLGDKDAYMAKFETCHTRTKTFTVYNLCKIHCIVKMFKIVKLQIPESIYELMKRSRRRDNYFTSLHPLSLFD